jgi:hypothetical protein
MPIPAVAGEGPDDRVALGCVLCLNRWEKQARLIVSPFVGWVFPVGGQVREAILGWSPVLGGSPAPHGDLDQADVD